MRSRAALVHRVGEDWQIEEIEDDSPKAGEVLVEWKAAGLCHSDEHIVTGDMVPPQEAWEMLGIESMFPIIGAHEGAGVGPAIGSRTVPRPHCSPSWARSLSTPASANRR